MLLGSLISLDLVQPQIVRFFIDTAQAVKVAAATPHVVAHLGALNEQRRRTDLRDQVFSGLLDGFNVNVVNLGTGVVLLVGARALRAGSFTVGDFALFVTYLNALTWFGDEISRWFLGYQQTAISMGRLAALVPSAAPSTLVVSMPIAAGDETTVGLTPLAGSDANSLQTLHIAGLATDQTETEPPRDQRPAVQ